MKRIPSAFVRNAETGLLTHQPAVDWFAEGKGIPYRKWDGVPCLIERVGEDPSYTFFRGVRFPRSEIPRPLRFIETSDQGDPETSGWVTVSPDDAVYVAALQELRGSDRLTEPGSYELCGPDIKDNHEALAGYALIHHRTMPYLLAPRDLEHLIFFMQQLPQPGEGIVWHYDGQYCQVTRRDVGLKWPL